MISWNDIEQQIRRRLHVEYGEDIRPVRDWLILLACAGVLLIGSALWNAWTYVRVADGEIIGGAPATVPIDTNSINAAEDVFAKRAAEEANYKNAYRFVDPSK